MQLTADEARKALDPDIYFANNIINTLILKAITDESNNHLDVDVELSQESRDVKEQIKRILTELGFTVYEHGKYFNIDWSEPKAMTYAGPKLDLLTAYTYYESWTPWQKEAQDIIDNHIEYDIRKAMVAKNQVKYKTVRSDGGVCLKNIWSKKTTGLKWNAGTADRYYSILPDESPAISYNCTFAIKNVLENNGFKCEFDRHDEHFVVSW